MKIEKVIKFIWNHKTPQTGKAILCKHSNAGGKTIPGLRTYRAVVMETVLLLAQKQTGDQGLKIKDPNVNTDKEGLLVVDNDVKHTQRKPVHNGTGKTGCSHVEE